MPWFHAGLGIVGSTQPSYDAAEVVPQVHPLRGGLDLLQQHREVALVLRGLVALVAIVLDEEVDRLELQALVAHDAAQVGHDGLVDPADEADVGAVAPNSMLSVGREPDMGRELDEVADNIVACGKSSRTASTSVSRTSSSAST